MVLRRVGSACAHNKDSSLATWGMTHVPIGNFVTKPYSMLHRVVIQNSGSQLLMSSPGVSLVIGKRKKLGSREDFYVLASAFRTLGLVGCWSGLFMVGCLQRRETDGSCVTLERHPSVHQPRVERPNFSFTPGFLTGGRLWAGVHYFFFRLNFFFILSSMYVVYVVGG